MDKPNFNLNHEEKKALLSLSRQTLAECFERDADQILKEFLKNYTSRDGALFENQPCFVTLHTRDGRLRGCIGCTETHQRLIDNVYIYTQFAAFRDPRFPPVESHEVDNLIIDIAVLGPPKPLPSLKDVVIGKHGLIVQKGLSQGLLLAKVATEYGWDVDEFLKHTYLKAGLPENTKNAKIMYFEEISFSERDVTP